jgi:hypothetical protein
MMIGRLGLILFARECNMANSKVTKIMTCLSLILYLTGGDVDAGRKINDKANNSGKGRKPPTISLSANPTTLTMNGSTTINWSSKHASDCTASGDWSGSKATSGFQTISALTTNSSFNLSCSGPGGNASDSVSVTVAAPLPTLSFSASPSTVSQNGSTTLDWSSTDVTNCTASGDWSGNKGATGSETINVSTIDSQFTLTCSGVGGTVNDTVNVAVVLSNNGTALLSWVPPTENTDGSTLTDLAGYKVYYGTSSGSYGAPITINDPGLSSYMVENLGISDWFFVMTAFNSSGIESSYSTEISKTIN